MIRRALLLLAATTLAACAPATTGAADPPRSEMPLAGAWRGFDFAVFDSTGAATYPFGRPVHASAVFDPGGTVSIHLMGTTADGSGIPRPDASRYLAYFGTWRVVGDTLRMRVEGSNMPSYLGSTQVRHFAIRNDTLRLGVPGEYQALLVRVRPASD